MEKRNEVEIIIRRLGRDSWSESIHKTSDPDTLVKSFNAILEKRGETEGSYQITIKVNGGYKKNPKTGATVVMNHKGTLDSTREIFPFLTRKVAG